MAEFPHLILPRAEVELERRKRPGFGTSTPRDPTAHSQRIREAVEGTIQSHSRLGGVIVDPHLILRVRVSHAVPEEQWERAGLAVLGQDQADSLILFSSDNDLQEFRRRVDAYSQGPPKGHKNPQYDSLIGAIEELGPLQPKDRIGPVFRAEGFSAPESFDPKGTFLVDTELWDVGTQDERADQVTQLDRDVSRRGGEITDRYIGTSFTALRVSGPGDLVRWLLSLPIVRSVDRPPTADLEIAKLLETTIVEIDQITPPDEDSPLVAIIDSGVNDGHPILRGVVVERTAVPKTLGFSDEFGHGSKVSGIAAYGDVRGCVERRQFRAKTRLISGKIVNDAGNFDDQRLVPSQIDETVRSLHRSGCRIFNLSLGDVSSVYSGGKVGLWTATIDLLARELNVLFVVSCGNYAHLPANGDQEDHYLGYPRYLLQSASRILEPAPAANALTVGAIAHSAAVREALHGDVALRPIAAEGQPAPFTRHGPGIGGAIKPELCDNGGNITFDGATRGILSRPEAEILTSHHRYLERLFTTAKGTSYAAPLVSHKAAVVAQAFPGASANLIRALLASSAAIPQQAIDLCALIGDEALGRLCGYGIPDPILATTSDRNRVVLYADGIIAMDKFYVYEVPVPRVFAETRGDRRIRVTLAFDPPTRHTRASYLGVEMSFRLIRGRSLGEVIEFFRKRDVESEGRHEDIPPANNCGFDVGPQDRERGTLQSATFQMKRNPAQEYGETYYLVVRCERQWHPDEFDTQRFAVVVELQHEAEIPLYEHVRERVEVRIRA